MATARQRFLARVLVRKYGEVGAVAARYVEAGYAVRVMHPTRYGPAHVIAQRGGEKLIIEVFKEPRPLEMRDVEPLLKKAELLRGRPVLVLYGDGPRLSNELFQELRGRGVKVRRIRAQ